MSINVADNFSYQGSKPLDARFQFATVAAMKAYAEASLYNGCFAYVTGTKEYYTYDSSNTVDSTTGRWRIFESGGGGASALSDLTDTTISNPTSGDVLSYNGTKWSNSAVPSDSTKQPKILDVPVIIDGDTYSTVESAIEALVSKSASVDYESLGSSQTLADVSTLNIGETHYYCTKFTHGESGSTKGFPFITEDKGNSTYYPYDYQAYTVVASKQLSTTTAITDIICFVICSSSNLAPSPRKFRICWKRCVNTSMPSEWTVLEDNVYNVGNIYTWRVTDSKREANWCDVGRTITAFAYLPANTSVPSSLSDTIPYPSSQVSMRVDYMYSSTLNESDRKITTICTVTWEESSVVNVKQYYRCSTKGSTMQDDWVYGSWVELGGGAEIDDTTTSASKVWSSNKTNTEIGKAYRDTDTAETALADADYVPFYDTSATAKKKTLWSNIKSVLKSYFDPYYKLVAGTNIGLTDDTNNRIISATNTISLNYSTSEQAIGTWLDGKTLFQRTYTGTTSASLGNTTIGNYTSTYKVKKIEAFISTSTALVPVAYCITSSTATDGAIRTWADGGTVGFTIKDNNFVSKSGWITIQYTKS